MVGANETAKAAPDGYSLGVATVSTVAANPAINPKNPYNPLTDFTPIINVAATPNVIAVHPSFPAKDFKTFLAVIKANPGKYSYATSGTGGIGHLQTELFKSLTGTFITHIPYRGATPALNDLMGGQISALVLTLGDLVQQAKAGRLRVLASSGPARSRFAPDVPTFGELKVAGLEQRDWFGIYIAGSPNSEVLTRVGVAVRKALLSPEYSRALAVGGIEASMSSPDELDKLGRNDLKRWGPIVKASGFSADS